MQASQPTYSRKPPRLTESLHVKSLYSPCGDQCSADKHSVRVNSLQKYDSEDALDAPVTVSGPGLVNGTLLMLMLVGLRVSSKISY